MCKCHPLIHHSLHFRVTLKHLIWPLWLFPLGSYILYGRKWCHCGRGHSQGRFDTFLFKSIFCKGGMIIFPSFNASGMFFFELTHMQPFVSKCSLSFSLRCCVMRESLFGPLCLSFGWFLPSCCSYWFLAGEKKKKMASISLHLYDDHHHHTTLLLWLLELETRAHSNVMEKSWWRPSKKM